MDTLTVCEKYLAASKQEYQLRPMLSEFIAKNGSLYAAIDKDGNILDRLVGIRGEGSWSIKEWLKTMLRLSLFEKYEINTPKTQSNLEPFIQVADATDEKQLLCYAETDYATLRKMYPNVTTISRRQSRWGLQKVRTVIVFVAAEPKDKSTLRIGEEHREIDLRLRLGKVGERFKLERVSAVRPEDLIDAFLRYEPTIVHFAGHGTAEGIYLEDRSGESVVVNGSALAAVFRALPGVIRGVVLNACYAKEEAEAIAEYVDWVVGIPDSIDDKAAIAYSVGLYQGIADARSFRESHNIGIAQMSAQGFSTEPEPELLTRRPGTGRT